MRLSEKRCIFTSKLADLLDFIVTKTNYHPVLDDVKASTGHMNHSLHYDGLAADIILYDLNMNYLTDSEDYRICGDYWESLHPNCYWGGSFGDGNHFSMSWDSRR